MRSWQVGIVLFIFARLMNKLCWLILPLISGLTLGLSVLAEDPPSILITPLDPGPESEVIHDFKTGISVATNGVAVKYGTTKLTADTVRLQVQSGEVLAEGDVTLQRDASLWRGERLRYNFRTDQIEADTFRIGLGPLFVVGQHFTTSENSKSYSATDSFFTTDDVSEPAFRIRARTLSVVPGESVEARKATVFVRNVPVMYFPYLGRNLKQHSKFFVFAPGFRSLYGPYLLGSYHWIVNTNLTAALNVDYRQKRGVGFGPDLNYDLGRWGKGAFSFYYLNDDDPNVDPNGLPIRDDRHRFEFSYQATLRTNLTAKIALRQQSDAQFNRDFFETQHRVDPQPKSFLELNQDWSNFNLNVLAQPQPNGFFQSVERLPDIKLTGFRQQVGVTPIYYEGENSAGYFRYQPGAGSLLDDYAAIRADTFHQLLVPQTFFGWLNVAPRVGGRMTHYGETDGRGTTLSEQNRGVFNTGAEFSLKASRVWSGARSTILDADGIRHIVEPSINYAFVPSPSKAPREIPQFDTEFPSLRLLPINFPDYNSIDSIDSQNVLRLMLRNKVQTKRGDGIDNLVNWALVADWRLDPRSDQTTFSDLYSDLDLKPRSWLLFSSEIRYGVENGILNLANHQATFEPNDVWSLSLGHRYFRENPDFGINSENNLIRSSIFFRFNENWAGRLTHHFEGRDGFMEEQYYTLYRDLRSWTSALTFRVREQRTRPTDFTIAVSFSLKAFPLFRLGSERDKHNLLFGS